MQKLTSKIFYPWKYPDLQYNYYQNVLDTSLSGFTNCFLFLLSAFLHTSPPFSELPCILEVDSFHMLVNLHFTLSSLFAAVTCPHGPGGPNGRNPVLPALIGITDQHLIRTTAASHILQYLITCPPSTAMDVDTRKPNMPCSFFLNQAEIIVILTFVQFHEKAINRIHCESSRTLIFLP